MDAACVFDGGALESCGSSTSCFSGTHYCNVGACTFVPDPCMCDHSCNCVEKSAADPCAGGDAGTRQCSDQNGYVVVWCSP
ncbi:MAG TPA: hypothetical protein VLM85_06705 [Polyangiaceae bacterium]|nr:hypothetical protein [Polyangiaceae bacterium]